MTPTSDIERAIREQGAVTVTPVTAPPFTVGQEDVRDIMQACGIGQDEAVARLARYVVERLDEENRDE